MQALRHATARSHEGGKSANQKNEGCVKASPSGLGEKTRPRAFGRWCVYLGWRRFGNWGILIFTCTDISVHIMVHANNLCMCVRVNMYTHAHLNKRLWWWITHFKLVSQMEEINTGACATPPTKLYLACQSCQVILADVAMNWSLKLSCVTNYYRYPIGLTMNERKVNLTQWWQLLFRLHRWIG